MAIPKQKFREAVFVSLYSMTQGGGSAELPQFVSETLKVSSADADRAFDYAATIMSKKEDLDDHIEDNSTDYAFYRIPSAEINILRLAVYEILYDDTVPNAVVIAEAIRLTKKFCGVNATQFVHAIADAVAKESCEPAHT